MKINQALVTGTILVGAGAYKTWQDYNEAPKGQKTRILVRNTAALGTAALAVLSADKFLAKNFSSEKLQGFSHKISSTILNNKIVKKLTGKLIPNKELQPVKFEALSNVIANCTNDVILTASAGLAGVSAGLLVDKIIYRKKAKEPATTANAQPKTTPKSLMPKSVDDFIQKPWVSKVANERTRDLLMNTTKVFEAAGFMQNPFEKPSVVLGGLDMAKEQNFQKIVEQTASGIVAEALIPTFCISLTNSLTTNKSMWVKIPAIAASMYVGNFIGEKVGNQLTHEIRDELFDIEEPEENEVEEKEK